MPYLLIHEIQNNESNEIIYEKEIHICIINRKWT